MCQRVPTAEQMVERHLPALQAAASGIAAEARQIGLLQDLPELRAVRKD
ncbi:hypothetical protein [Pseudacidovorax intermedius]|nr:hypothetical protein [Pseudacidovorax intermedius]